MPRRARRQLNFYDALPSGWFVVWFCSLLGFCHVLFPLPPAPPDNAIQWPTQFGASCDGGMLPLFLPPLHPDSTREVRWDFPYKTAAKLDALRQWRDIDFTGAPLTDFMAFASTIQAVKAMQDTTSYKAGLRIHFRPHSTFSSLVATLDRLYILEQQDTASQEYYWLDIRQEPVIRYFIAVKVD
jgi:hypothetical protein